MLMECDSINIYAINFTKLSYRFCMQIQSRSHCFVNYIYREFPRKNMPDSWYESFHIAISVVWIKTADIKAVWSNTARHYHHQCVAMFLHYQVIDITLCKYIWLGCTYIFGRGYFEGEIFANYKFDLMYLWFVSVLLFSRKINPLLCFKIIPGILYIKYNSIFLIYGMTYDIVMLKSVISTVKYYDIREYARV